MEISLNSREIAGGMVKKDDHLSVGGWVRTDLLGGITACGRQP